MTKIIPFLFEYEHTLRGIIRDGDPWFILADVCRILEIGNPSDAARRLDDDERYDLTIDQLSGLTVGNADGQSGLTLDNIEGQSPKGGARRWTIVNESGLYALIMTSRKPAAKKFRKWVTSEVIPSIRKTGKYEMPGFNGGGAPPHEGAQATSTPRPPERAPITHADIPLDLLRSWTHIIREARILRGPRAAMAMWNTSPLADLMPMPDMPPADLDENGLHYAQRGDPACLDHLLAARLLSNAPCLRDMVAGYFDAATTPARRNDIREALRPLGVLIEPIGWQNAVAVARRSQAIKDVYRGTHWQESWPVMLLQLRGVRPGGQHRFGEQNSRTVLLPKRLIVD